MLQFTINPLLSPPEGLFILGPSEGGGLNIDGGRAYLRGGGAYLM